MATSVVIAEAIAAFGRGELGRARALTEAQLHGDGESADAHHLLGLIECREGRPEQGVTHLQAAVDARPDDPAFRVMLARALVDAGRPREALDAAARPKDASPAAMALWHARAEAAQAASDHSAAAEAWAVLCAARANDWRSWANYGDALARIEHWEEAANALRRAWTLNPQELPIQRNFAAALTKAGFHAEAADQLRAMLERGAEDAATRLTLARLLADLGRHQDSMAQLDKAAQLTVGRAAGGDNESLIRIALSHASGTEPPSAAEMQALRELASLLERTNRLDALRRLLDDAEALGIPRERLGYPAAAIAFRDGDAVEARRLLEVEGSATDAVRWHRLMARIQDRLGDAQAAFDAATAMNASVQDFAGSVRKGADYRHRVRELARIVTPEWGGKVRPLQPGARPAPAFLVGFPRSGTTLLDTFLMGHPETEVLEEFNMLRAAERVLGNIAQLPSRTSEKLEQARRAYFTELGRHADADSPRLIVDKLPLNMLSLPVIYGLFPKARIIFAQRHPCDCVLSGFMQSFTVSDSMSSFLTVEGSADFYDAAMNLFSASREALPLAVHTLVYEQLIADPEAALRPLIDFLGLEWQPELLDHRSTAKARGAIVTPSYDQVVEPLTKTPSGRWRRYRSQLEPVLPLLLPWAERLGYPS